MTYLTWKSEARKNNVSKMSKIFEGMMSKTLRSMFVDKDSAYTRVIRHDAVEEPTLFTLQSINNSLSCHSVLCFARLFTVKRIEINTIYILYSNSAAWCQRSQLKMNFFF